VHQRTYEDAPPRPAVVPLEPKQDVAKKAKALHGSERHECRQAGRLISE
jgi:hypothetical protein